MLKNLGKGTAHPHLETGERGSRSLGQHSLRDHLQMNPEVFSRKSSRREPKVQQCPEGDLGKKVELVMYKGGGTASIKCL